MRAYTVAENISILQDELNYFNNRLLEADSEETKYIKRRISEIKKEIIRYFEENQLKTVT